MDLKALLELLAKLFDNQQIKEMAEGLKDNAVAIPDDMAEQLQGHIDEGMSNFLSVEAAQNNPKLEKFFKTKLFPTLKGEILGNIDSEIDNSAATLFSSEVAQEILAEENTKNKLKLFNEHSQKLLKKRMPDEESKKKLEDLSKKYNDAQAKWAEQLKSKDQEVQAEKQKVHETLIRSKVVEMAKKYPWRESLSDPEVQPVLIDKVFQKLKSQATLKYNEAGEVEVFDRENPETLLFDNNKKLTVKDLLDKEIKPYLDAAPAKKKTSGQPPERPKAPGDVPTGMRDSIKQGAEQFRNTLI